LRDGINSPSFAKYSVGDVLMQTTATAMDGLREIVGKFPKSRQYLIPILQEIQESCGYVPREGIFQVSEYLGLPEAKIFGVATFYNQFKLTPPGKHQIQVCRGTACHVRGSASLLEILEAELGIQAGETTKDGLFSLDVVACIGACSIAPVITVDGEYHGRLDKKLVVKVFDQYREKAAAESNESDKPKEAVHA
jgi:NADH-quinone oxidoreductase subunit E